MSVDTPPKRALLVDTLTERVDALLPAREVPPGWGSPHLSATPIPLAVCELAATVAALEEAVREIALEVDRLSREDGSVA